MLCFYDRSNKMQTLNKGRKEMAEEIITSTNAETATDHEYNASEIQVLKGLEAVRKRRHVYRFHRRARPASSGLRDRGQRHR